ncbi:histidine kinase [Haloechinothrix sp. LS1_15]|uniref:sensor histidine kinase n=1 Tax=Haloechinothrix sp. LS1_15 TaxID=2652248 RepID=UPI00294ADA1E|nr:histidine kinase [Haloechinothrix sp. LS1_15]
MRRRAYRTYLGYAVLAMATIAGATLVQLALPGGSWRDWLLTIGLPLLVAASACVIGVLTHRLRLLRRRVAELERDRAAWQEEQRQQVAAEERARLARDMHDVVAHDITLITMQANALESAGTVEAARETAGVISQLSNRTLDELRAVISMLRAGAEPRDGCHDLSRLECLAEAVGVVTRFHRDPLPQDVPEPVTIAVYRTVQEALINARKHAPGATATVRIGYDGEAVRVEVRNTPPTAAGAPLPSGGHGLAGLAERALLLGGRFHARSTDDGGFEVTARYPIDTMRR